MKAPNFKKWFARLPALNQPQRLQTLAALHPAAGLDRIIALIDQVRVPERRCPRCACKRYHRHGQANGLQRYRCRECGRQTVGALVGRGSLKTAQLERHLLPRLDRPFLSHRDVRPSPTRKAATSRCLSAVEG